MIFTSLRDGRCDDCTPCSVCGRQTCTEDGAHQCVCGSTVCPEDEPCHDEYRCGRLDDHEEHEWQPTLPSERDGTTYWCEGHVETEGAA